MGINGYFSLRVDVNEELEAPEKLDAFTRRWAEIFATIRTFKQRQGVADMPFLFTELGYTFRRHSTVEPWAHAGFSVIGWGTRQRQLVVWGDQPVDYDERKLALEALRTVHYAHEHEMVGILYWKLSTDKDHEQIEPFVLHVGPDSEDPLQDVLVGFLDDLPAGRKQLLP
jgi:hypothetical protein